MKDMREGEMRHVAPGTNPNEHIRTDSQIRLSGKKKLLLQKRRVLRPPAETSSNKVVKNLLEGDDVRFFSSSTNSPRLYHQNPAWEDEKKAVR